MLTSYQDYGTPGTKRFTWARPLFYAQPGYIPGVTCQVNYDQGAANVSVSIGAQSGVVWDSSDWDTASWGDGTVPTQKWQGLRALGNVGAMRVKVSVAEPVTLNHIDVMHERGGVL
jgi:hypothetical protein